MRTVMLIVAVASGFLFVGSMLWRRQRYLEAAAMHANLERQNQVWDRFWFVDSGRVQTLGETKSPALANHHAALAEKYREAARHPWMAVAPDPSAPGQ